MTRSRLTALFFLAVSLGSTSGTSGEASRSYYRTHQLHSLDYRVAETLAWEICREVGSTEQDPCKVTSADSHNINVLGPDEAHARIVQALTQRDPPGRPASRFEVTLVRVVTPSREGLPRDVPAHVRTALDGVKELMPESGFEILATGQVRTSDQGRIVLADPDGNHYQVDLHYRGRRTGFDRTELTLGVTAIHVSNNPNLRDLLSTSLTMFAGETVVVGSSTSRLSEGEVLVLLLTAGE